MKILKLILPLLCNKRLNRPYKKVLILTFYSLSWGNVQSQSNAQYVQFDSILSNLSNQHIQYFKHLWNLQVITCQYLCNTTDTNGHSYYRQKITGFYISLFDTALHSGLDLRQDYDKIICYRWSVMIPIDTMSERGKWHYSSYEQARLQNEESCNKKNTYRGFIDTCNAFHDYYKMTYRRRHIQFSEIKNLTFDFFTNKDKSNYDTVLKILRDCKCNKMPYD